METLWFCLVALMLALYVVFDGFDLGAGAVHLLVARDDAERTEVLRSIGPVWDGNEVWLLAAGGTLYFAFPALYAASFSGFYLPLMIVLWLLILRGIAIEFRNHLRSPAWGPLWDVVFAGASALLAVFFGAALGNVVRGVPLNAEGRFFLPLWTDFLPGPRPGVLDWFTVLVGLGALAALTMHGALWVALKTNVPVASRARAVSRAAWAATLVLTGAITWFAFAIQPQIAANLASRPWGWIFPAAAAGGLLGVPLFERAGKETRAFLASCLHLLGMLASAAFGLYPYVLPAVGDPARGLTAAAAAAPEYGLRVGLGWWLVGMALVAVYFTVTYRRFAGKVSAAPGEGY
ncbi:MAG TPA: cytochrome d ubiquinol oxidase subunit II [Acidobacteriota bacterium]|nr:cytochrome d ubiquinol oxidase subunit II [Acidobacteriota bacterium]